MDKTVAMRGIHRQAMTCQACELCKTRSKVVFGDGSFDTDLMFIGEGPGANEDKQGKPFVGRSGRLLDDMIRAMGLHRPSVYICNIVKCRPPNNRDPKPDEVNKCIHYLIDQIGIVQPTVICTLGRPAAQTLLQTTSALGVLRGRWHKLELDNHGSFLVMPTYHPAYLLRSPGKKPKAWEDLQKIMRKLSDGKV